MTEAVLHQWSYSRARDSEAIILPDGRCDLVVEIGRDGVVSLHYAGLDTRMHRCSGKPAMPMDRRRWTEYSAMTQPGDRMVVSQGQCAARSPGAQRSGNLVRDRWREAAPLFRTVADAELERLDALAQHPEQALLDIMPDWLAGARNGD
ncbi:hypothetical protein [Devosia lacusdianchii]|uniref:hypothetical protein n=1 Tax=Devosia lacusdianchii TaxID=2917991 RepID=UPI001F059D69|nr:hypothetical protein [Devosia sp. JXJ CY 41]